MKLERKKALAARALSVGAGRIVFNSARLSEVKEAITKQDFKDLKESGAVFVKELRGRRKVVRRKTRRRMGSVRKKINTRKKDYMTLTRKLRSHLKHQKDNGKLSSEEVSQLRREIRSKDFRSLAHFKERIGSLKK